MIPAEQLCVGNSIISVFNNVETVRAIHGHENIQSTHQFYTHLVMVEESGNQYNLGEIKPLFLTDEVVRRAGFEAKRLGKLTLYSYPFARNKTFVFREVDGLYTLSGYNDFSVEFYAMHQLQNLFFFISGQKLVYKKEEVIHN